MVSCDCCLQKNGIEIATLQASPLLSGILDTLQGSALPSVLLGGCGQGHPSTCTPAVLSSSREGCHPNLPCMPGGGREDSRKGCQWTQPCCRVLGVAPPQPACRRCHRPLHNTLSSWHVNSRQTLAINVHLLCSERSRTKTGKTGADRIPNSNRRHAGTRGYG